MLSAFLGSYDHNDFAEIPANLFNHIFAIYLKTSFACDGFPLKINRSLFIDGFEAYNSLVNPEYLKYTFANKFIPIDVHVRATLKESAFVDDIEEPSCSYSSNQISLLMIKVALNKLIEHD